MKIGDLTLIIIKKVMNSKFYVQKPLIDNDYLRCCNN